MFGAPTTVGYTPPAITGLGFGFGIAIVVIVFVLLFLFGLLWFLGTLF